MTNSGVQRESLRVAPYFKKSDDRSASPILAYTARSLSDFLGWSHPNGEASSKVEIALQALELIELGLAGGPRSTEILKLGFGGILADRFPSVTAREAALVKDLRVSK